MLIYYVSDNETPTLYIKVGCSFCMEGKRGGVFANCAYCNHERKTYIEASLVEIAKYITDLDKESHHMFLNLLYKESEDLNDKE
tara:strand:- start:552 stop:803 length:252 start_codon:yes stop_codon:yes gene_type:complete